MLAESDEAQFFNCLQGKKLISIDFFDSGSNDEDSRLELKFSEGYVLIIQTFWRICNELKILAMSSERYLLPNRLAPEKDYQNLKLEKSLLFNNLVTVKNNFINSIVEKVDVNVITDIEITFTNGLIVQGLINCRSNSYMYYGLFQNGEEIIKITFDWKL